MTSSLNEKSILYIVHSYNSFTKDQIESLAPYFKKVYVLVRYKPIAEISRFISFLSQYKYHQKKFAIDLNGKPSNVEVIAVSIFYLPGDFFYKKIGDRLFKKCLNVIRNKDIQFDLIHAHFAWSSGYVAHRLSSIFKVPFLITLHGEDIYDLPFRDEEWRIKITKIVSSAIQLICVGQKNVIALNQLGLTKNISLIGNGFKPEYFYPISKDNAKLKINYLLEAPLILSIGSLDEIKGHKYMIEALGILKQKSFNFYCLIIGTGPERKKLNSLIKKFNLENNIEFVENVPHSQLVYYYNSANVFCLPSIHESFGVVQIEAWACGVPVVATRNGGSECLFKETDNVGYLCNPGDSEELAKYLELSLQKKWDFDCIKLFSLKFKLDNLIKNIYSIYHKSLI